MVLECPAVAALDAEVPGSPTTYLPGRRVAGISIGERNVSVQVRMRWGTTADVLNQQIRVALAPIAAGRRIDITIADIALPGHLDESAGVSPTPA